MAVGTGLCAYGMLRTAGTKRLLPHIPDVASGTLKAEFMGHLSYISSVTFSPDGKTLASGGTDRDVHLWDVATGEHKIALTGHTDRITSVAFSPGGIILLWRLGTTEELPPLEVDVNGDGVEDVHDLVLVAANFGQTGPNAADVNGDGVVDIADLIKVAAALDNAAAAPSAVILNV